MDQARKRFLAAVAVFVAWVLVLTVMAATSGRLPRRVADAPVLPAPANR